jgi:cytochrome bd-type quinol oxidase subunit 2
MRFISMKDIKLKLQLIAAVLMAAMVLLSAPALAVDTTGAIKCGANAAAGADCSASPSTDLNGTVITIVNVLSAVAGVAAVIMIIVAGFRYITSGGQQESVASAKRGLTYAIIGLVVAALAQIIARFVLHNVAK